MRKRIFQALGALAILCATFCFAYAAEPDGGIPQEPAPAVALYPAEIRVAEEHGNHYLEKIYYLSASDDPAGIPTADFDREGRNYKLVDILKNDMTETDTKDYIEVITRESETKELSEIIMALEPQLEVSTEDGYTGVLKPDYTSIQVEAAGYGTSSWTASATRTYPNLSDADINLIPKTTEDSGRTLTLANVDWQETTTDMVDGEAIGVRYTAMATYTGTVTGRYATGYTVTVDYTGQVTKTSSDTIIYTAVFESLADPEPEATPEPTLSASAEEKKDSEAAEAPAGQTQQEKETGVRKTVILTLVAVLVLGIVGYAGYIIIKSYKKKKS